jgi:hypothetical protein
MSPTITTPSSRRSTTPSTSEIVVEPSWFEPLNLFTVVVSDPGNRKSPMFADRVAPLEEFEEEEARLLAPAIQEAETARRIAEPRLDKAPGRAAKAASDERMKLDAELSSLPANSRRFEVPSIPCLTAYDVTPEQRRREDPGIHDHQTPDADVRARCDSRPWLF